jgi:hypothetical protein
VASAEKAVTGHKTGGSPEEPPGLSHA